MRSDTEHSLHDSHVADSDLDKYVRFCLVGEEREVFENHLFNCPDCQRRLSGRYAAVDGQHDQWPDLANGDVLENRYQIVDKLGEGGLSFIFLAKDVESGQHRVLKFPKRTYCSRFPITEEHQFLRKLDHESIVKPIALGVHNQIEYLVLQKVDGVPLHEFQQRTLLDEVRLFRQVTSALAHSHDENIYHLDLHPGNIVIQENTQTPCIIDFGIGAHRDAPHRIGVGTKGYMSPERVSGQQCDARADVWSLGVLLYERLSGRHPFDQLEGYDNAPKPLKTLRPDISKSLSDLSLRCLKLNPSDRPEDAGCVLKLLDAIPELTRSLRRTAIAKATSMGLVIVLAALAVYNLSTPNTAVDAAAVSWQELDRLPDKIRPGERISIHLLDGKTLQVDKSVEVPTGASLKITGDGELRFSEDAGLLVAGQIEIAGDNAKALRLGPKSETGTWRGVILSGKGCNGSRIMNSAFISGTGWRCMYSDPALYRGDKYEPPKLEILEDAPAIGGALTIANCEDIKVISCLFQNNRSTRGGALCAVDVVSLWLRDCVFDHNSAGKEWGEAKNPPKGNSPGGAIFAQNCHDLAIRGCEFVENAARDKFSCGGAIYLGFNCNVKIHENTVFESNYAQYVGGAIYAFRMKPKVIDTTQEREVSGKSFCEIVTCDFVGNMAGAEVSGAAGDGTAIYVNDGYSADIVNCMFRDQFAYQSIVGVEGQADNPCRMNLQGCEFLVGQDWAKLELCISAPNQSEHDEVKFEAKVSVSDPILRKMLLTGGFEERTGGRAIDTVVIHHASAIRWDSENRTPFDQEFKKRFYETLPDGLRSLDESERTFCPEFVIGIFDAYGVGSHYLISRDAEILQLVPEKDVAFHAGRSVMPEKFESTTRGSINEFSLGVELIGTHPNDDPRVSESIGFDSATSTPAYTYKQYHALAWLMKDIGRRSRIRFVVGHDEITEHRDSPKTDPGQLFDWTRVRDQQTGAPLMR